MFFNLHRHHQDIHGVALPAMIQTRNPLLGFPSDLTEPELVRCG